MRILTFNWHEAYICTLAKTGYKIDVVERLKGGSRIWFYETRPVPENVLIVKEKSAYKRLRENYYDLIICHNVNDLLWVSDFFCPKVLIFHNMLTTLLALGNNKEVIDSHRREYKNIIEGTKNLNLVFISESKKRDWGFDGTVITPGIDLNDYSGYHGSEQKVLRVGNFIKNRDLMMGYSDQVKILDGLPSTLLGLNEPELNGRFTRSWEDLKENFRSHRVYLNTTVNGFEDGYNLAMLEAMATGMPVVSTYNATSPIKDAVNGYISDNHKILHDRIKLLFNDQALATKLGNEARKSVEQEFSIKDFVSKWGNLIETATENAKISHKNIISVSEKKIENNKIDKKILLAYVSYPATTARYIENSLRRVASVITIGPSIGEEVIKSWNLENMKEKVRPHNIPCGNNVNISEEVALLPDETKPDLFLWIESVYGYFPDDVSKLTCPTACYMIDSHLNLSWHIHWAIQFDYVFIAQREYLEAFKKAGCKNVFWLPLACDSEIHKKVECEKKYDLSFVGSITGNHQRRKSLLEKLSQKVNVHIERSFLRDMAVTFSSSKIVFNNAVKNDLNMRVFEVLATGALLLTDRAEGSGLEEFFTDRKHLVIYEDETIADTCEYFLTHDSEREEIAKAGMEEVLSKHTYDHRVKDLLEIIFPGVTKVDAVSKKIEDPLLSKSLALVKEKKFDEALTHLVNSRQGRELSSFESFELECTEGACLLQLGRDEEGKKCYEKALARDPYSDKPMLGLGAYYFNKGKLEKAMDCYRGALSKNSKSMKAKCGIAITTFFKGDKIKAFELFCDILDQTPDDNMALFYLLQTGYELNKFGIIEVYLKKHLELHPADVEILFALGGVYYKQRVFGKVRDILDTIFLFKPDHQGASDLLKKIEKELAV